jgi:hypothetical protein
MGSEKELSLQSCSQSLVVQKAVVGEELRLEAGEERNQERHQVEETVVAQPPQLQPPCIADNTERTPHSHHTLHMDLRLHSTEHIEQHSQHLQLDCQPQVLLTLLGS